MTAPDCRLIADIGGTNARFALCDDRFRVSEFRALRCADFAGPAEAALAYLDDVKPGTRPTQAAFAVACPVAGDRIELTNNAWSFSIEETRRRLGLARLRLVNDFVAVVLSLPYLEDGDLAQVGTGRRESGFPMAAIGPGTGLGVSAVLPVGGAWLPLPSEGGHVTLATIGGRESAIADVLLQEYGHVSTERAVSGPGFVNLYRAICRLDGVAADPLIKPADVTARAIAGSCAQCGEAVRTFCRLLGTAASNLAITLDARGGVFLGGGILASMIDTLVASEFRARFEQKGRFSAYLRAIPTFVITHEKPAMVGLAHFVASD